MKKVILGVAIAGLAMSCQKIQAGGNKGILKAEVNAGRYSDDVMTDKAMPVKATSPKTVTGMASMDSTKASGMQVNAVKMDSAKAVTPASGPVTTESK